MGIYSLNEKSIKNPLRMIESVDFDEIVKLQEKSIAKIYNYNSNYKTLIEIALDKYMQEENIIIIENLEKIIIYLLGYKYRREPYYYATYIELWNKNQNLYKLICEDKKIEIVKNLDEINNMIIENHIENDDHESLIQYLIFLQKKINKMHIDLLIKYKAQNTIHELIKNKILDDYLTYYLILMSGEVNNVSDFDLDIEIAMNFFKEIVSNGIYDSFIYLIDRDETIIKTLFEDRKNILYYLKPNNKFEKIIKKIFETMPELANICDDNGETALIYHSKYNPELLKFILNYDSIDLTITDNDGNTCLHHLCKQDEQKILKYILKKYPELINLPNKNFEYPVTIACKNKREEMFYILKYNKANLEVKDKYGNTPYHYICANSICINMEIKNIPNFFGSTPKDYCYLSHKYYSFLECEEGD
jgi:ankyrin repeat protein